MQLSRRQTQQNLKSQYNALKFKYLTLKIQKNGGYTETTPMHLAAACIAVVNCTYLGSNQESVDCPVSADPTLERIKIIQEELKNLENVSGVKAINKKRELNMELSKLSVSKTKVDTPSVNNRTCDTTLATVASIYLSIIYHTDKNKFMLTINDLINSKINNCEVALRSNEKKKQITEYYLRPIKKMNDYLLNICERKTGSANCVTYEDIFTNAEYGKQDKEIVKKLKELKGFVISADDEENFRMVNQFIGPNLNKVALLDLHTIIDDISSINNEQKQSLKSGTNYSVPTNANINTNNFIAFGVYTYDRNTNTTTVKNKITNSEAKQRDLFV